MTKGLVAFVIASVLAAPMASAHPPTPVKGDEGCQVMNPLRPTCAFEVTHTSESPVTGAAGWGDWIVLVKRDGETIKYKGAPDGRFWMIEISYKVGDKVTVKALSPGSAADAGHFD